MFIALLTFVTTGQLSKTDWSILGRTKSGVALVRKAGDRFEAVISQSDGKVVHKWREISRPISVSKDGTLIYSPKSTNALTAATQPNGMEGSLAYRLTFDRLSVFPGRTMVEIPFYGRGDHFGFSQEDGKLVHIRNNATPIVRVFSLISGKCLNEYPLPDYVGVSFNDNDLAVYQSTVYFRGYETKARASSENPPGVVWSFDLNGRKPKVLQRFSVPFNDESYLSRKVIEVFPDGKAIVFKPNAYAGALIVKL